MLKSARGVSRAIVKVKLICLNLYGTMAVVVVSVLSLLVSVWLLCAPLGAVMCVYVTELECALFVTRSSQAFSFIRLLMVCCKTSSHCVFEYIYTAGYTSMHCWHIFPTTDVVYQTSAKWKVFSAQTHSLAFKNCLRSVGVSGVSLINDLMKCSHIDLIGVCLNVALFSRYLITLEIKLKSSFQ